MSHHNAAFDIDDSAMTASGFTYRCAYPAKFTGHNFILTNRDTLCVKVYSNNQTSHCFAVGFGQFLSKNWIHVESEESCTWDSTEYYAEQYAQEQYHKMLARAPEHARSMDKARSESQVCFMQTCLPQWTLHTRIVWMSSRENRVKLEVFRDPGFGYVPGEWTGIDVDVGGIFPVSAHYFHISNDIAIHRKWMIPIVTGGL